MTLQCARCLLAGKRLPTKRDHIGDDRYAWHSAVVVLDGNSLCQGHLIEAIKEQKKVKA